GQARGIGPADLLPRVLELAGVPDNAASANLAGADPRAPPRTSAAPRPPPGASWTWPASPTRRPAPTWPAPTPASPPNRARRWYPRVVPVPVRRFAQWLRRTWSP